MKESAWYESPHDDDKIADHLLKRTLLGRMKQAFKWLKGYPQSWRSFKHFSARLSWPYVTILFHPDEPPWTVGVVSVVRLDGGFPTVGDLVKAMEESILRAMMPPSAGQATDDFADEGFAKEYPALAAFLTLRTLGKGKTRETATLSVWSDSQGWHACVYDRQNDRRLFVTVGAWIDLLEAVETLLGDPKAPWRASGGKPKKTT